MACNCGRKRLADTSVNISDTAGQPTEGARTVAQRLAAARAAAERNAASGTSDGSNTTAS